MSVDYMALALFQVPASVSGLQHMEGHGATEQAAQVIITLSCSCHTQKEAAINAWNDWITQPGEHMLHECCTTVSWVIPLMIHVIVLRLVFAVCSHLVFFREFFRQLLPETPPSSNTSSKRRVPYIRQTTFECFQHITKCPVARQRLLRQRAEGGLVGGAGGRGRTKSVSQQLPSDSSSEELP